MSAVVAMMQIVAVHEFVRAVLSFAIFGVLGVLLIILGYKAFDWVAIRIDVDRELTEKQNIAVAIVAAAVIIGISIVIAAAIIP